MDPQYIVIIVLLVIIFYYLFIRKTNSLLDSSCSEWDLTDEIKEFNKIQKKYLESVKIL